MKLGLYALAAVFMIVAAMLVVFAPAGREAITGVVALALFALAVGAAGFGTFTIKAPFMNAKAS